MMTIPSMAVACGPVCRQFLQQRRGEDQLCIWPGFLRVLRCRLHRNDFDGLAAQRIPISGKDAVLFAFYAKSFGYDIGRIETFSNNLGQLQTGSANIATRSARDLNVHPVAFDVQEFEFVIRGGGEKNGRSFGWPRQNRCATFFERPPDWVDVPDCVGFPADFAAPQRARLMRFSSASRFMRNEDNSSVEGGVAPAVGAGG